jgi:two-component system phosphate regulon response regulator OmpR
MWRGSYSAAAKPDKGKGACNKAPSPMEATRIDIPDHAPHVLVVDDDRRLRDLLTRFLTENGYRVTAAASAAEARSKSENFVFDALVLDVMMPGESGFDYARGLRQTSQVPILMLTARADASDRVTGLEIGADDYLPKPFEPRELLLRLGNILKRATPAPGGSGGDAPEIVHFGPFSFRFDRGELRRGDEIVRITEREREILTILGSQTGDNVPREALSGNGAGANERTVDVQINRLRRKIETDPANPIFLQTVRGIGYRLVIDR